MNKQRFQLRHRSLWLVAIAAVLLYGGTAAASELSVCIDKTSPTAALNTSLARAIAAQEGSTLHVHEFDGSGDDEGLGPKEFNKLAKESCALVLGFPIDADEQSVPAGLRATTPYGHTGFVLVTARDNAADTLSELPKNSEVAVIYMTTPNLYFANHPGLQADVHVTDADAFKALETHKVGAAMLWQPTVVRFLADRNQAARFSYHELHEPHAQFNLVALYDSDHAPAAAAFERAIAALSRSGALAKMLAPYAEIGAAQPIDHARSTTLWRSVRHGRIERTCGTTTASAKAAPPPALYTEVQAASGKQKFEDNCAQCHGPNLEGRAGPALKGPNFANAKSDFHVSDIFTIVSQNMPATQPGSLPPQDYVEIMAFLLQQNGYPAGTTALTFDEAKASTVSLIYRGN